MNNFTLIFIILVVIILLISISLFLFKRNKESYEQLDLGKGPYGNPLVGNWFPPIPQFYSGFDPYSSSYLNLYPYPYPRRRRIRRRQPLYLPGGVYGCPLRDGCLI